MNYSRLVPSPPLSKFVDWFWYYDGLDLPHNRERVLPDGGFELIINLQDEPRKLFDRQDPSRFELFHRGWFSGAHSEYLVIDVLRGSSMVGAHFKPAGAAPFLGMPADELRKRVVDLEAVWGTSAWNWRDRLLAARGPQAKFGVLRTMLLEKLDAQAIDDSRRRRVDWAVERCIREPHVGNLQTICNELGLSQKHFIHEFRRQVGLTPKLFCRIRRFQNALAQIGARKSLDWFDIVYSCGYYDQPHFINDFRAFSGLKPSAYLENKLEYPNFTSTEG